MRLRPLTEEECYARCYGGRRDESVSLVRARALERIPAERELERGTAADQAEANEAA